MAAISLPYSAAEALTQVRALIGESSAAFWSDEDLNNWVIEGSVDIRTKTLCQEHKNTIALVANQLEYTDFESAPTTNGIAQVIKVYSVIYDAGSNVYRGLNKIHPKQINHLGEATPGPPYYYWHFAGKIGLFPVPTATEAALTNPIIVYCSIMYIPTAADAIVDIPDFYQPFAVTYAAAMARFKERKNVEGLALYTKYINSMNIHRADIYDRMVDAKSDFQIPNRTVEAQPR